VKIAILVTRKRLTSAADYKTAINSLCTIESRIIELKDKFLNKGGDEVLKHYELNHFNLPFNFSD
jgi:hypothetical protein